MFLSHGIPWYGQHIRQFYENYSGVMVLAVIFGFIIAYMASTVLVDQVRKAFWAICLKMLKVVKVIDA